MRRVHGYLAQTRCIMMTCWHTVIMDDIFLRHPQRNRGWRAAISLMYVDVFLTVFLVIAISIHIFAVSFQAILIYLTYVQRSSLARVHVLRHTQPTYLCPPRHRCLRFPPIFYLFRKRADSAFRCATLTFHC